MVTDFDHSIRKLVGYRMMSETDDVYGHLLWAAAHDAVHNAMSG